MRELEFRIKGFTEERLELESHRDRRRVSTASVVLVVISVVLAIKISQPNPGAAHIALVHGKEVKADRVLILIDNSGSMAGTDNEVRFQLSRLLASGISVSNQVNVPGFAISLTDSYSLLGTFNKQVAEDPRIDT